MPTKTQVELHDEALAQLAILGGKLTTEEDIVFKGKKFILPEHLSLREARDTLSARVSEEENEVRYEETFPYRPMDGARATALAIKEYAGFTLGKTLYTFFGKQLPQLINVKTGPGENDVEQVPWGAMTIPNMSGVTFYLGSSKDPELGAVYHIVAEGPKRWRFEIAGLFKLIKKHLKENSIYKGKAIDGGENFIDVSVLDPRDVVFTESVQLRLEADVWCFLRHGELLKKYGQDGKFAALFEGTFGVGKSLAALLTAQHAVNNGWTFLMCRPGQDNLVTLCEMARMYQPAVIFGEDVDVAAGPQARNTIERHLDVIDGIKAKGLKLLSVFTTNHAEEIHKGMLRPGRIGAVIRFGAMERDGVERLTKRVLGNSLDPNTDFDKVYERCEGYMPAFIREVIDRSVRYSITNNDGKVGLIGTTALTLAADGLRDQYELMQSAKEDKPKDTLTTAVRGIVERVVDHTAVKDNDGDVMYTLAANGG